MWFKSIKTPSSRRADTISNMHLFILTTALVLLPQVCTLRCWLCHSDNNCTDQECAPEQTRCKVERSFIYEGDVKVQEFTEKSCAVAKDCIERSFNIGVKRSRATSECCSSDLCNTIIPDTPKITPNGKKCYFCDERGDCSRTLNCDWIEDQCFTQKIRTIRTKETTMMMRGCLSKSLCNHYNNMWDILSHSCSEAFYNGVSGGSASLLVLVTLLISVLLFSN